MGLRLCVSPPEWHILQKWRGRSCAQGYRGVYPPQKNVKLWEELLAIEEDRLASLMGDVCWIFLNSPKMPCVYGA